jgi:GntR family transcriptional regulator/MocR family aminotransferase
MLSCLGEALPDLEVEGAAAGLHLTLRLSSDIDEAGEAAMLAALRRRGLATEGLGRYSSTASGPRRLFLGYGRISESGIAQSVRILAEAILAQRVPERARR